MEVDPQLNLFEPIYLLRESTLKKLREFDLDGAQEDLNQIEVAEPENPFATSSLIAITEFRKRLFRALQGRDLPEGALALQEAWGEFQSEAGSRFSVNSTVLSCIAAGVRRQLIQMLEAASPEEVIALYPRLSLGHLKLEEGDHQGASEALEKLLALHQGNPGILTSLANVYYHLGRYAEADEHYLRALFEDADYALREGLENKVLTLSLESFLEEDMALCWFPVYAVLSGALKLSPSLLHRVPRAHDENGETESPSEALDEKKRAGLFYVYLAGTEEAARSGDEKTLLELSEKMKELKPAAFEWYTAYKSQP